jgi:hypothetical protein
MTTSQLKLGWKEIEKDCASLARQLSNQKFDVTVAITKGGLIPAVILVNKFLGKTNIITLQLEEISKEREANYHATEVRVVSELNLYPINNKRVLIIDDVADTGKSLSKAIEIVKSKSPKKITTAVLHHKPRSQVTPQYKARTVPNNTWIVYPWEKSKP